MIADFGLSKHLADIKSNSAVLGMLAYISNAKLDIYSLGAFLRPFSQIHLYNIDL